MENAKFQLLEIGTMEGLREYPTLKALHEDLYWKDPMGFWIGVVEEKKAYTIPQIFEKYADEFAKLDEELRGK